MITKEGKIVLASKDDPIVLESGEKIGPVEVAYETYGQLNEKKSNAILICHAFSGSAHAAGKKSQKEKPGWWDYMIGPKKPFDTDKYFVICSNVLGGCSGTTGPSSINPETNKPYALDFPLISIGDMVKVQKMLIDHFGIEKLFCVAGGSMGGMQSLSWMINYPDNIQNAILIATAVRHSPMQIAFHEVGRQAIMADPSWQGGNYYGVSIPAKGLAIARMLGHITYMSEESMEEKFGRQRKDLKSTFKYNADFEVEHYLRYRGDTFVKRFDANTYLYLTKAMDNFDAANGKPLEEVIKGHKYRVLIISFTSDWLYPSKHSKEIVKACKRAGVDSVYCEINSRYGHDAFLLDLEEQATLIRNFLNSSAKVKRHEHKSGL